MKSLAKAKRQAKHIRLLYLIPLVLLAVYGCRKDHSVTEGLTPYSIEAPNGFPAMEIPDDNRPFEERIALGRRLYYDAILSNDGRSCSTCHLQKKGFTINTSQGMPVLPHVNMGWKNNFMWDGSEQGTLEDVMLFEVEEFFGSDIEKLNRHPQYPELFAEAYGTEKITSREVAKALAQFARVMISSDSKFDRVQRGIASFTDAEARGYAIFNSEKGSCYHCHTPPLFTDDRLHNTGLDSTYGNPADRGHFNVTGDSADLGMMRTPTLRNLSLRERYMHDGRFASIEEVVEHYNSGVKRSATLDPVMVKHGGNTKLGLSAQETAELTAFLKTLSDSTFTNNELLSKP